jgi:hypothetical protein
LRRGREEYNHTMENDHDAPLRRFNRNAIIFVLTVFCVLLAVVAVATWSTSPDVNAKHTKAQLQAKHIANACAAYTNHPDAKGQPPRSLDDLLTPPFGGTSFLQHGEFDLLDPWVKRFQIAPHEMGDGSTGVLIFTFAGDGTPISQFGIGPASQVKR